MKMKRTRNNRTDDRLGKPDEFVMCSTDLQQDEDQAIKEEVARSSDFFTTTYLVNN